MHSNIEVVEQKISDLKDKLRTHEIYTVFNNLNDIHIFMQHHVYAVWDFMSLLKAIQIKLTCVSLPWKPVSNATTARFINEIVLGEESDLNEIGIPKSHFEMYLDAMHEVGISSTEVNTLISNCNTIEDTITSIQKSDLNTALKDFLLHTFNVIKTGEIHKIACAFTFGRENLIPDMFVEIIKSYETKHHKKFPKLTYYFERHIEVDGDEHGPLSLEMINELCGDDEKKWTDVSTIAEESLKQRISLWDSICLLYTSPSPRDA